MSTDDERRSQRGAKPLPPRLDPRLGRDRTGSTAASAGSGRRGTRLAWAARATAAVLSLVLLGTSGWGWYLGRVAEAGVNRTDAIPGSGNSGSGGAPSAMNLLLVGNDSRTSLTEEQEDQLHTGDNAGLNTDTMILVHVPADGSKASFVSFPRDSYVQIPGHGWDKLNAAYSYGYQNAPSGAAEPEKLAQGAQLLVQTISSVTGLQIDHYAEVDLLGFFNLASVVGGVEVNLCKPVNDPKYSGAVFPAGPQTITGADALRFVRQRHGLPRGDFDRIVRQQVFLAGVLRKILSDEVLLDLGKQRELVSAAAQSVTVDQSLDLFQLAEQMQSVDPGNIDFQTVPYVGDDRDENDRYILRLKDTEELHAFFADLSAEPAPAAVEPTKSAAPPPAPAEVTVAVLNGSGKAGLAGTAATALQGAGFVVSGTDNADSSDYERTEIRYKDGEEALAKTVLAAIPGAKTVKKDGVATGTVQLVLGTDFNGVGQPVTKAAPATTTGGGAAGETKGETARTAADTSCIN